MRNPAVSPKQYRLAEAVLHGTARGPVRMSKKVAKEIVDRTPAKQRSEFMKGHSKRKNFLGFGGSKTTFASKLQKDAYEAGRAGKGGQRSTTFFSDWYAKLPELERKTHHTALKAKLRSEYERGVRQEHADHLAGIKTKVSELKAEKRSTPKPEKPGKGDTGPIDYKGLSIKRTQAGFEVKGETWNTLAQAKEYADYWVASSGKIGTRRNSAKTSKAVKKSAPKSRNSYTKPKGSGGATLTQGKSTAEIYDAGGKHVAEISGPGGREEHSFSGPGSFRAAMSWARLRLHEVANPGTRFKVYPLSKNRRKNPAEPAARMYEKFHGAPSTEVREYIEKVHRHSWLFGMGPLISIKLRSVNGNREAELPFPDPEDASIGDVVMLSATEDGSQLECVGGDQQLDPKSFTGNFGMVPIDFARDNVFLGTITEITYRTRKTFEKDGKEEIDFYHALGSEGSRGIYPVLIYHPRNPSLEIAGGRYYIGKAESSLGGVSPGIIG
jgi:hypothetical protein